MKKITAYVKPFKLESVLERLPKVGIHEVLLADVRGYGRQKGHLEMYRDHEYKLTFLPKARIEIYCEDDTCSAAIDAVVSGARTGRIGDGKLMVCDIECPAFS
jgi:nitrogen regulatory protein PII